MRRKIKHLKRYKDYPKNVPKKLLKEFFTIHHLSVSMLAQAREVNSGTVSALLNDGREPKDSLTRSKLYLPLYPICPCCKRKIVNRKPSNLPKIERTEWVKAWNKLSVVERHKVIEEYITWKSNATSANLEQHKQKET